MSQMEFNKRHFFHAENAGDLGVGEIEVGQWQVGDVGTQLAVSGGAREVEALEVAALERKEFGQLGVAGEIE